MKQITLRVDDDVHHRLKMRAVEERTTMQALLLSGVGVGISVVEPRAQVRSLPDTPASCKCRIPQIQRGVPGKHHDGECPAR